MISIFHSAHLKHCAVDPIFGLYVSSSNQIPVKSSSLVDLQYQNLTSPQLSSPLLWQQIWDNAPGHIFHTMSHINSHFRAK